MPVLRGFEQRCRLVLSRALEMVGAAVPALGVAVVPAGRCPLDVSRSRTGDIELGPCSGFGAAHRGWGTCRRLSRMWRPQLRETTPTCPPSSSQLSALKELRSRARVRGPAHRHWRITDPTVRQVWEAARGAEERRTVLVVPGHHVGDRWLIGGSPLRAPTPSSPWTVPLNSGVAQQVAPVGRTTSLAPSLRNRSMGPPPESPQSPQDFQRSRRPSNSNQCIRAGQRITSSIYKRHSLVGEQFEMYFDI